MYVVHRRMIAPPVRALIDGIQDARDLSLLHPGREPVRKVRDPGRRRRIMAVVPGKELAQVVRRTARTDDENAVLPERRQRLPEFEVIAGRLRDVDRDLHNRYVGVRVDQHQGHPGAVIQTTPRVHGRLDAGGLQHTDEIVGQLRFAGDRIPEFVQCLREPAEVVDGFRLGATGNLGDGSIVVRGDDDDRPRPGQPGSQAPQKAPRRAVLESQRWRTV